MDYQAYMSSQLWKQKRKERLEIDGHRCRLCDHDGSQYRLEVHHRPSSYKLIPNESVIDDLTTVCSRCHEFITAICRGDRYDARALPDISIVVSQVYERKDVDYGMAKNQLSVNISLPHVTTQRADSGSDQQMVKSDQNDFVKTRQNRR